MAAPDRAGIDSLVARLREEQRRANEELAGFVAPDRLEALDERLSDLVSEARAAAPDEPPPPGDTATDGAGG
jgi:hypothetical protein